MGGIGCSRCALWFASPPPRRVLRGPCCPGHFLNPLLWRVGVGVGVPQYLAGVSVAAGTVDGPNPLLVINSRTSIAVPLPVRVGHVPVVEGNHMVSTNRAQVGRR